MRIRPELLLAGIAVVACAAAQPFKVSGKFSPRLGEAAQRKAVDYTGFVFNFNEVAADDTPNGDIQQNLIAQNPFLSTLPGDGNGQALIKLGPCAGVGVHTHPRGSEIAYVTSGDLDFGMIEENVPDQGNVPVVRRIKTGETIHIPQGLLHFSHNPTCKPAEFLASFGTADPGTQMMWNSVANIPNNVLHMSTGIPEATWADLKKFPLVKAPSTGGEECLKRCNRDFKKDTAFVNSATKAASAAGGENPTTSGATSGTGAAAASAYVGPVSATSSAGPGASGASATGDVTSTSVTGPSSASASKSTSGH